MKYASRRMTIARDIYDNIVPDLLQQTPAIHMTREDIEYILPHILSILGTKMFQHDNIYRDNEFLMWLSNVAEEHIEDRR